MSVELLLSAIKKKEATLTAVYTRELFEKLGYKIFYKPCVSTTSIESCSKNYEQQDTVSLIFPSYNLTVSSDVHKSCSNFHCRIKSKICVHFSDPIIPPTEGIILTMSALNTYQGSVPKTPIDSRLLSYELCAYGKLDGIDVPNKTCFVKNLHVPTTANLKKTTLGIILEKDK